MVGAGNFIEDLMSVYGVDKRNLAITHGTQEGNFAALTALRELGLIEKVTTVIPEYEPIRVLPRFLRLRQNELRINGSLTELLNHIEKGSALFFSNPNNPLGVFLSSKLLWELSDELRRRGVLMPLLTRYSWSSWRIISGTYPWRMWSLPLAHLSFTQ